MKRCDPLGDSVVPRSVDPRTRLADRVCYLSIQQPYAHAVITGLKTIENRSRPSHHRGLLVIHAGKSRASMYPYDDRIPIEWYAPIYPLSFGFLIGAVIMTDCVFVDRPLPPRRSAEYAKCKAIQDNEFAHGPFCYLLEGFVRFAHPVPWTANVGVRPLDDANSMIRTDDIVAVNRLVREFCKHA